MQWADSKLWALTGTLIFSTFSGPGLSPPGAGVVTILGNMGLLGTLSGPSRSDLKGSDMFELCQHKITGSTQQHGAVWERRLFNCPFQFPVFTFTGRSLKMILYYLFNIQRSDWMFNHLRKLAFNNQYMWSLVEWFLSLEAVSWVIPSNSCRAGHHS